MKQNPIAQLAFSILLVIGLWWLWTLARGLVGAQLSYPFLLWVAVGLCGILFLYPAIYYLIVGWTDTRSTIVCRMKGSAIEHYFGFFPIDPNPLACIEQPTPHDYRKTFIAFYNWHFGVRRFVIPILLLWTFAAFALSWIAHAVDSWLNAPAAVPENSWKWLAVAALAGAYMRTMYDQITDSARREMSPATFMWGAFRIAVAVPIGYSFAAPLKNEFGPALAFLLGFFPTRELFTIGRRIATKRFDLGEAGQAAESELQVKLQGVDHRQAERFADARVTTIGQLAYTDPVKLAIRGNFELDYVIDCISQALLWIYLEDDIAKIRKYGIRGAQEAKNLWDESKGVTPEMTAADAEAKQALADAKAALAQQTDPAKQAAAQIVVNDAQSDADAAAADLLHAPALKTAATAAFTAAAAELKMDLAAFTRTIGEVAEDPFVEFLHEIWSETC